MIPTTKSIRFYRNYGVLDMINCPYCHSSLGDLESVMDSLSENSAGDAEVNFDAPCCGMRLRAYARVMAYYLVPVEEEKANDPSPQLIGHA